MEQHPAPWNSFGSRLRLARMAARVSQADLSRRLGKIGNGWLSSLESGRWKMPANLDEVATLAHAVKVTPEWLLFARNFKSKKVVALGIGGGNVDLPGEQDGCDRFAIWPGVWAKRTGVPGPRPELQLVCTTALQATHDLIVWWDRELVVGYADVAEVRNAEDKLQGFVASLKIDRKQVVVQPLARVLSTRMPR